MRYLSVVGTRPQLMKLKPVVDAFSIFGIEHDYVDTGQHYDANLSSVLATDLGLKKPLVGLKSREASGTLQLGSMINELHVLFNELKPSGVIVYGDTNSTLAATIAAKKQKLFVAHIESGLRSRNLQMSEEQNRIMVDHVSDLLFAPTRTAMKNLELENLATRSKLVGDVMFDLLQFYDKRDPIEDSTKSNVYIATIHRAENTDSYNNLHSILNSLERFRELVVLYAHPRLLARIDEYEFKIPNNVTLEYPLTHSQMYKALKSCKGLITDSGGLQKEAYLLEIPCVTLREETEWPETFSGNWNILANVDCHLSDLFAVPRVKQFENLFGDGEAALKIVEVLLQ